MDDVSRNLEEDKAIYEEGRRDRELELEKQRLEEDSIPSDRPSRSVASSIAPSIRRPRTVVTSTYEDSYFSEKFSQVAFYIAAVLSTLLALRFLFQLFAARKVGFVFFINQITEPLVSPFRGLFGVQKNLGGGSRFEIETIVALVMVVLVAYLLAGLVRVLSQPPD